MTELPVSPSYINIHLTAKGRYYWDIKLNLPDNVQPNYAASALQSFDSQLREKFPQNTAEMPIQGRVSSKDVDLFEE